MDTSLAVARHTVPANTPRTWRAIVAVEAWPIACRDRSFPVRSLQRASNGSELAISSCRLQRPSFRRRSRRLVNPETESGVSKARRCPAASLTGKELAFARPANEPASPKPQNPPADAQQPQEHACSGQEVHGDPISVNLKDVDLKDFFRLIHEISGLNIVLDPALRDGNAGLDEVRGTRAWTLCCATTGSTRKSTATFCE